MDGPLAHYIECSRTYLNYFSFIMSTANVDKLQTDTLHLYQDRLKLQLTGVANIKLLAKKNHHSLVKISEKNRSANGISQTFSSMQCTPCFAFNMKTRSSYFWLLT